MHPNIETAVAEFIRQCAPPPGNSVVRVDIETEPCGNCWYDCDHEPSAVVSVRYAETGSNGYHTEGMEISRYDVEELLTALLVDQPVQRESDSQQ